VHVLDSSAEAIALIQQVVRDGDVLLVLSLGGFDKIAGRLVSALEASRVH
jgi:UDP-N-acetylmuramate-alanine ligase